MLDSPRDSIEVFPLFLCFHGCIVPGNYLVADKYIASICKSNNANTPSQPLNKPFSIHRQPSQLRTTIPKCYPLATPSVEYRALFDRCGLPAATALRTSSARSPTDHVFYSSPLLYTDLSFRSFPLRPETVLYHLSRSISASILAG